MNTKKQNPEDHQDQYSQQYQVYEPDYNYLEEEIPDDILEQEYQVQELLEEQYSQESYFEAPPETQTKNQIKTHSTINRTPHSTKINNQTKNNNQAQAQKENKTPVHNISKSKWKNHKGPLNPHLNNLEPNNTQAHSYKNTEEKENSDKNKGNTKPKAAPKTTPKSATTKNKKEEHPSLFFGIGSSEQNNPAPPNPKQPAESTNTENTKTENEKPSYYGACWEMMSYAEKIIYLDKQEQETMRFGSRPAKVPPHLPWPPPATPKKMVYYSDNRRKYQKPGELD